MFITNSLFEELISKAKKSSRLRVNFCLHKTQEDKVQKMINVICPGSEVPIHRHLNTEETLVLLKGKIIIRYYNEKMEEVENFELSSNNPVIDIMRGQWHSITVTEPVILLEIKEGPYRPLKNDEILNGNK